MKLAKLVLAGSVLMGIASSASAQQTQSGTVGSSTGGAVERQFKASDDLLEKVHAGDIVTVSVGESGGKKTITKIESR